MKRTEVKSLKQIFDDIKVNNSETYDNIDKARIPELWSEIAGDVISNSTQEIFIKGNKLFISFDNPIVKYEVLLSKHSYLFELNKKIGRKLITDITIK